MNLDQGLKYLEKADIKMGELIKELGPPILNPIDNYFEALTRSIIYQQLNTKSASKIYNRYKSIFNNEDFQSPLIVLNVPFKKMKSAGLSLQKINYIKDLSVKWPGIESKLSNIDQMTDDEISRELLQVKGIGQWTIDMFLIFTLVRPDVFPLGDLIIQKGLAKFKEMNRLPSIHEMENFSKIWKPYRTIAAMYLWNIIDRKFEWKT